MRRSAPPPSSGWSPSPFRGGMQYIRFRLKAFYRSALEGALAPGRLNLFKGLKPIIYGGREVWPLIEGGKGVSATNHASSGAWAAAGGIGTVSAVNADSYDAEGRIIPQVYEALTRRDRHEELIKYAIDGAVAQVQRAYEMASGK